MAATVALDVGQTGTKVRIFGNPHIVRTTLPGIRTDTPLAHQIESMVRTVRKEWGQPFATVAAGVSGLIDAYAEATEVHNGLRDLDVERVVLAHDSVTSYLGALGDSAGAVVAAGTGVVVLGVGRSRVARVDGWGNIMGDAGSGYWVGRAGLEAAMRAYDGRATTTRLTELLERWPDPEQAYIELQQDPDRVRTVASFAEQVIRLAPDDPTAESICLAAARELCLSVDAALRRAHGGPETWPEGPEVAAVGGLFAAEQIRDPFERLLRALWPHAVIAVPRGDGLDGAGALPQLAADHPLRSRVADVR